MAAPHSFNAQRRLLAWGEGKGWFKTREAAAGLGLAVDGTGHALRRMMKCGRAEQRGGKMNMEWRVKFAPFVEPARGPVAVEMTEEQILRPTKAGYYPDWPVRPLLHHLW